jgi:hypothetical protein
MGKLQNYKKIVPPPPSLHIREDGYLLNGFQKVHLPHPLNRVELNLLLPSSPT